MESQSLAKQSVSKLKALALYKGINIKGCLEKDDIVAALKAGGVTDRDVIVQGSASTSSPISPPSAPTAGSSGVGGSSTSACQSEDASRPSKFARTGDVGGDASVNGKDEEPKTEKKGLKFFQMKKGDREAVAKNIAERKLPPPAPRPVPLFMQKGGAVPKVVEAKASVGLTSLSVTQLQALARDLKTNIDGCLEKEDIIKKLNQAGVSDEAAKKPRVVIPPKLKAPPPKPQEPTLSPQESFLLQQGKAQEQWQSWLDVHNKFSNKFVRGAFWEIQTWFPLWAHEDSDERVGIMSDTAANGRRTVIEIVLVGQTRLRVRATRFNPLTRQLTGTDPTGWMDLGSTYDKTTGKLLMRPYDATGMYVDTKTGQEPVLMRRTVVQEKLRIDSDMGAGLHLTATPAGMQVDDIDTSPGQPGLAVGDLIVGIGGVNLVGLKGKTAVEAAFRSAFVDGAELEVAA